MICPRCLSVRCRLSSRRTAIDRTVELLGLRLWCCGRCEDRFYTCSVALRFMYLAHCGRCGNFDLQRIGRNYVKGWFAWPLRMMRASAYRCEPCRNRFFSIRPYRPPRPIDAFDEE